MNEISTVKIKAVIVFIGTLSLSFHLKNYTVSQMSGHDELVGSFVLRSCKAICLELPTVIV